MLPGEDLKLPKFELATYVYGVNPYGTRVVDVKKPAELCVPATVTP
ncbi:MAG: hypothetical protein ABIR79_11010 [Candidatus Binatia bacterium]